MTPNRGSLSPGWTVRRRQFETLRCAARALARRLADADVPPADLGENGHSLGYLLSLGGFQLLNLGDMTPDREHALACPENRIGVVDLWQVPHHGGYGAIRAELAAALQPTVAVVNNGPRKGGTPDSLEVVQATAEVGRRLAVAPHDDRRRRPPDR